LDGEEGGAGWNLRSFPGVEVALCPPPDTAEGVPLRDEISFEEFYTGVFNRLVGQLFLVTGSLPEAEDVVQEALTRAAGRWALLRDYEVPEIWVRRVAMNLATDGFRRARRRLLLAARLVPDPHPPPPVEGVVVAEALRGLPLGQRKAVVLHYLLDLPVDQVATELGVPVGTVKSRLARARAALATRLESEGVRPDGRLQDHGGAMNRG
jgi:RNA polymerase sigma-70 factor, ECF subfamily